MEPTAQIHRLTALSADDLALLHTSLAFVRVHRMNFVNEMGIVLPKRHLDELQDLLHNHLESVLAAQDSLQ